MKYFAKHWGPFGPKQTGAYSTTSFDTVEKRAKYIKDSQGGLSSLSKVWMEPENEWEREKIEEARMGLS